MDNIEYAKIIKNFSSRSKNLYVSNPQNYNVAKLLENIKLIKVPKESFIKTELRKIYIIITRYFINNDFDNYYYNFDTKFDNEIRTIIGGKFNAIEILDNISKIFIIL